MGEPVFTCDNPLLQSKYDAAVAGLRSNIRKVNTYPHPVLWEGGVYGGIWLECGPHESLVFLDYDPQAALHSHRIFMHFQRADGYFPAYILDKKIGSGQVQTVVPFARSAFAVAQRLNDRRFMAEVLHAAGRYDRWLSLHRDTRKTGCCEMFCEWDTGQDNSPRAKGLPRECPGGDARKCPAVPGLPYLAPDLSAAVYGGRLALTRMAVDLEDTDAAGLWRSRAAEIRDAMMKHLFDAKDACFYDLKSDGEFLRTRTEALLCVLREHVVDQSTFERIYQSHIRNAARFWTPFPFPSVAADDPMFVKDLPVNCWGGASQALTALRAPLWMEHYGKWADLAQLMKRWIAALLRAPAFMQQMNPFTGEFAGTPDYSPAMLCMVDFVRRLYGVREQDGRIQWNCRMPEGAQSCRFSASVCRAACEIRTDTQFSSLLINGREIAQVIGVGRVVTDERGRILHVSGTEESDGILVLRLEGKPNRPLSVRPNARAYL